MSLTELACKNAKPREKAYKLTDGDGMYLEVLPAGGKYWRMKYRYLSKEKRLAIGVYPEIGLAEARSIREEARRKLRAGEDPSFAKQEQKRILKLNAENTFEAIAREWHQHQKDRWSENHASTIIRRLEGDVFPEIGNIPIRDVSPPRVLKVIQQIQKQRNAHEIARRALQYISSVFRYAIMTSRAETNPCDALKGAIKPTKKGHYAAMEIRELPEFLEILRRNDARLYMETRLAVEMIMLTFVRTGELIKAKWSEFDLDERVWIIPAERMKMRQSHLVPLSTQVLKILDELKRLNDNREYVFPSQRNPKKHMSNGAILMALDRMGYRGKHTGHGFRALAMSTIKERLDYRHEVIDRQLAHAHKNQVDAAYDRAKFLDERKIMMQEWADYLDRLMQKNVITADFKAA